MPWYDDEAVIRAAGEACQMARFHNCSIEVHISRRLGRKLDVVVAPQPEPRLEPEEISHDERTEILQQVPKEGA
jgi:hypothetical protein